MNAPAALLHPSAPAPARNVVIDVARPAVRRPAPLSRGVAIADLMSLGATGEALVVRDFRVGRRG
jgi:hypothetical protein